ncbi:hypothetical protein WR25_05153 [Diploscapter pachys]|uniref:Uncharacterized protein n=1 Tax=Diploscapter pachys TaxID=2018661 RepID=A0A2A2JZK9_9BILA|nr:hypothetical protein WR25_05153 [Diploscapter pachys]
MAFGGLLNDFLDEKQPIAMGWKRKNLAMNMRKQSLGEPIHAEQMIVKKMSNSVDYRTRLKALHQKQSLCSISTLSSVGSR